MAAVCSPRTSQAAGEEENTHPLHQHQLSLPHHGLVCPGSLLSEDCDELLQPPLLDVRRDIVLQPVEGSGLLWAGEGTTSAQPSTTSPSTTSPQPSQLGCPSGPSSAQLFLVSWNAFMC